MNRRAFLREKLDNFRNYLEASDCPPEIFQELLSYSEDIDTFICTILSFLKPYEHDLEGALQTFAASKEISLDTMSEDVKEKVLRYLQFFCSQV